MYSTKIKAGDVFNRDFARENFASNGIQTPNLRTHCVHRCSLTFIVGLGLLLILARLGPFKLPVPHVGQRSSEFPKAAKSEQRNTVMVLLLRVFRISSESRSSKTNLLLKASICCRRLGLMVFRCFAILSKSEKRGAAKQFPKI